MKRIPVAELAKNVLHLPRLPIPTLAATADNYRAALKPLRSGDSAAQHLAKLDTFLDSSAPVLQKHLIETDKAAVEAGGYPYSYVEALMERSILSSRVPLEVNMNAGFVLKKGIPGTDNTQSGVAAGLVYGIACWIKDAIANGVEVKDATQDVSPLLTEFGRSLIPSRESDTIWTTPLEQLRHIIVLHDGHPYAVRVFDEHQNVIDRPVLQKAMELILSITPDHDNTTPVTVLTAGSRAVWGQAYQDLLKTPENAAALQMFKDSIIVVCLDSNAWNSDECLAEASALHGSKEEAENRWYDKHQMIVSPDGQVAFNFEPTTSGRVHWSRWIDDVLSVLAANSGASSSSSSTSNTAGADPAALTALVKPVSITYGKSFVTHIRTARQEAMNLANGTEVHSVHIPYGRAEFASVNVQPDSFVQICLQLALYTLRGKLSPTAEQCGTTGFFHGSTEIVRTATEELRVVAEYLDGVKSAQAHAAAAAAAAAAVAAATGGGGGEGEGTAKKTADAAAAATAPPAPSVSTTTKDEFASLLRLAAGRHTQLTNAACCGAGMERHLMALHNVARINGDKAGLAFFEDEVFQSCRSFLMHASAFSRPWLQHYLLGPANSNSYGLGYVIDEHEVRLSITAYTSSPQTNTSDFVAAIQSNAAMMYRGLGGKENVPKSDPPSA